MQIQIAPWAQLMADFTEPGRPGKGGGAGATHKRELTQALRQKLIMHILALALMVGDGTLTGTPPLPLPFALRARLTAPPLRPSAAAAAIAGPLELTPERVCFYLKQLGCSVKTSGSGEAKTRTATLTVPLTFPKASQGPPTRK